MQESLKFNGKRNIGRSLPHFCGRQNHSHDMLSQGRRIE